jgi:hypothetical protein
MNDINNMTFFGYDICRDKEGYDLVEGGSYLYKTKGKAKRAMIKRAEQDFKAGDSFYYHLIQNTTTIKETYSPITIK